MLPALYTLSSFYDFDLRATHARTLLPAALASVSFGFVLVRVRVPLLLGYLTNFDLGASYVNLAGFKIKGQFYDRMSRSTSQRTRVHFCPQHWLLCHLGLY